MALVSEVADGIYQIEPEGMVNGIICMGYLVVDKWIALIETGSSSQIPEILSGIAKLGYGADSLSYIIPTHIHADHGGGVGYLAQQAPQAEVILHQRGAPHVIDPTKLIEGTRQTFGNNYEKLFGPMLPVSESQVKVVKGGESISLGTRQLGIIDAPGHAPHHICIHDTKSEGLFCGEALGCYVPADDALMLASAPPIFELDLALETIDRLENLKPKVLFFSQWGVNYEASRMIQLSRDYTKTSGDIVLESMRAGEPEGVLMKKLQPYMRDSQYVRSEYLQRTLRTFVVSPYAAYFKREGLL